MQNFIERHDAKIKGVISCFDRIVLTGTIPGVCYAEGMTSVLFKKNIQIFDYTNFVEPMREEIRLNAEKLAAENGLEIDFVRKKNFRKEDRIDDIIKQRGSHPGLVHIFSAMEPCTAYKPWHNKKTHKTYLKTVPGKCLHYYFYFITAEFGLCYLRVPTWAPFRLQFYCNGHNMLASRLSKKKINSKILDNVFVQIDDFDKAKNLAEGINVRRIHRQLDKLVRQYCPIIRHFTHSYHWSFMQIEYATDIIFKKKNDLKSIYDEIVRTAIHSVKVENIATFLGRKLHGSYQDEMGNNFNTRIEGTCIKHRMGKVAIKMYDKFGIVLRVETVTNDVSFFKPNITLFGGEPLLHPACMELIRYIKKAKMHCLMITNGSLLEEFAEDIVEAGMDELNLSLDGDRELHNEIRGMPGLFEKIVNGLKKVNRVKKEKEHKKPFINLQCTIT